MQRFSKEQCMKIDHILWPQGTNNNRNIVPSLHNLHATFYEPCYLTTTRSSKSCSNIDQVGKRQPNIAKQTYIELQESFRFALWRHASELNCKWALYSPDIGMPRSTGLSLYVERVSLFSLQRCMLLRSKSKAKWIIYLPFSTHVQEMLDIQLASVFP